MRITTKNCQMINTKAVYLHDDSMLQLKYNCETREMEIMLEKFATKDVYRIMFYGVAGFEVSGCDFWGGGEARIIDFYLETETRPLCMRLMEKSRENARIAECPVGLMKLDVFESVFLFASGDELRIAADSIVIQDASDDVAN